MMYSGGRVCWALGTISALLLILTNGDKGEGICLHIQFEW